VIIIFSTLQEKRKTKWIIYFSAKGIKNMKSRERKRNPIGEYTLQ
jgi:hypothetical protein